MSLKRINKGELENNMKRLYIYRRGCTKSCFIYTGHY